MHLLTGFSLKNRALIALVTIVAAVFGLIGVGSLKQELMPSVQFPAVAVVTTYPGASPEVVNKDVSGPVETALRGVPNLESTSATSSTGASMVLAQFTYGVDIPSTEQKAERAISRIAQLLPEGAESQVISGSIDDFPIVQIAVSPAEGDTPEDTAQMLERVAIPQLDEIVGVREAQLSGARDQRITITPDQAALSANGLTEQAITDTLQQSGVLMAGGTITDGDRTLAVQAGSTVESAEQIENLPLARSAAELAAQQQALEATADQIADRGFVTVDPFAPEQGEETALLTIGDVADVETGPGPQMSISRVNGEPSLTIGVTKLSTANTVDVSHAVQDVLDELEPQLAGAEMTVVFDQAPYIEESISTLTTEGLLGLIFAVIVILVFLLSVRATLVTAISIPVSVLLTFIGLNFADYTLNMLTLGALTISIGRVVDDSIVVIENIKRHLAASPHASATKTIVHAVREVAGAITASTVVTVAVFLPIALVNGMVGELFRPFAFTVTIALAASLLVALTIVPVLAYWFLRGRAGSRGADPAEDSTAAETIADPARVAAQAEQERGVSRWLARGYRPIIDWTLRRPVATLLIAVVVLAGTLAATPLMKTNFLGDDEQNSVGLTQTLAPGTSLDAQLAQAERVEEALSDIDEVETVQVTLGGGGGPESLFGGGDGAVSYSITTDPDAKQTAVQDRIRAAVDALDDAGEFSLGAGAAAFGSSAIEVQVTAPDQQTLADASDAVRDALEQQSGIEQVESDLAESRPYLRVEVDRTAAAEVGLTEAAVAGQIASRMQPRQIGQVTMDADTVAVYLAAGTAPTDQAGIEAMSVQTPVGGRALSTLATVAVADGPVTVSTQDGVRMVTVSALPKGDDLTSAGAAVNRALDSVDLPAGATAHVGGVMSQQSEAFGQLGIALLVAILIVYVVMVATFRSLLQPLLLLVSIPFAATGALLLLIATGIPLGVASLIGVLMLVGIVVTNAIVLIDLVNQFRERGEPLREAVLHGSMQRLRPIVMTALATIFALTPMSLGITGKGGFISQPLGVVVIGGLLSSTVLTLVVLPTLYYLVERRRELGAARRRGRSVNPDEPVAPAGAALDGAGTAAGSASPAATAALFGAGAASAAETSAETSEMLETSAEASAASATIPEDGGAAEEPEDATDAANLESAVEADTSASDVSDPDISDPEISDSESPEDAAPSAAPAGADESDEPGAADAPIVADEQQPAAPGLRRRARLGRISRGIEAGAVAGVAAGSLAGAASSAGDAIVPPADEAGDAAGTGTDARPGNAEAGSESALRSRLSRLDMDRRVAALREKIDERIAAPETFSRQPGVEPGLETAQMSLALSELGFVGEENPLATVEPNSEAASEQAVESFGEPTVPAFQGPESNLAESVEGSERSESAEPNLAESTEKTESTESAETEQPEASEPPGEADQLDAAEPESGFGSEGRESDDAESDSAESDNAESDAAAADLAWEDLLSQATQEVDEEIAAEAAEARRDSAPEASGGGAPGDPERGAERGAGERD